MQARGAGGRPARCQLHRLPTPRLNTLNDDDRDGYFASKRVPGRFYVSRRLPHDESAIQPAHRRFAYQVFDSDGSIEFESENGWDLALRETRSRQQLRALFFEDDRRIEHLSFQRFSPLGEKVQRECFVLQAEEVGELANFLALVFSRDVQLPAPDEGMRLTPAVVGRLLRDEGVREDVYGEHKEALAALIAADVGAPEVIAFARRAAELQKFERLMVDSLLLEQRRSELRSMGRRSGAEDVWQDFFESNKWGYSGQVSPHNS